MFTKQLPGNLNKQRKKKEEEIAQSLRESLNKYFSKQTDSSLDNVVEDLPPNENDINKNENENDTNDCENANDLNILYPKVWDNLDEKNERFTFKKGSCKRKYFQIPFDEHFWVFI